MLYIYNTLGNGSIMNKLPFEIRMAILIFVGGCIPIFIHHLVHKLWDVSILRAAEITFIFCIPVAFGWQIKLMNVGMMIRSKYVFKR